MSTHAARVHKHDYYNSPAPRKLASNTNCNLNNLKYVDPASQLPLNTSLARRSTNKFKQLFQYWNELALAPRDTQITQTKIPPIRNYSTNILKSHHSQIKSVVFALNHPTNESFISTSRNSFPSKFFSETNSISKKIYNMPSKKRITRVRINDASRTANQQNSNQSTTRPASQRSNSPGSTCTASQRSNSPSNTRTASSPQITTPTSPAPFSNVSTPLTTSPQVPTFDCIVSKIFNKSLIASLTSKGAVLKEVRDCILTNNCLKALNPIR